MRRWPVLVSSFVLALALAAPAQAAFPGQNGKIAFNSGGLSIYTPGNTIEVMNPDGTGRATLTTGSDPAWSPDGTRIAFLRGDGLYVAAADGSGATLIRPTVARMSDPTWSPDGAQLAFIRVGRCDPHEGWCNRNRLYITNADGTNEHEVPTRAARAAEPSWSPDGTRFVATDENDYVDLSRIFTVNVDGSDFTYITYGFPGTASYSPSWAPDASRILYMRVDYGGLAGDVTFRVVSARPDGTGLAAVIPGFTPYPGAWAPDGSRILLALSRDAEYPPTIDLVLVDPGGGNVVQLTDDPAIEGNPDWQPLVGPRRADYKNQAAFCRAERDFWGDGQFRDKYGTNGNGANAFGKCIRGK